VLTDINLEAAQTTAQLIGERGKRGSKAVAVLANASSVADARTVMAEAVQQFGRLDILVNNAGIYPFTPAMQLTEEQWDGVLSINLKGAFFYAQAAAQFMMAAGTGCIVNIASIDGLHPTGYLAHYDASKGGLIMLTKSLAKELGPAGITVNAIAPGAINTPGASAGTAAQPATEAQAETAKAFMARIPLGRTGQPDDIATAVLFLTSRAASYMTGGLIIVDGGYLLS
jgi:2-deoxy-D-gluconate 3-dehydrogenase